MKVSEQHILINNKFYLFLLLYFLFPNKFHSFAMFQLPSSLYAAWVRGTDIYLRKDVYYVFVFEASKLRNFWTVVKEQSNGRCLRGMLYILSTPLLCQHKVYFVVIHIGVGYLGVARSDWLGNAKASKQGTSNRYRFPRFFFLYELILIYLNRPVRESADIIWDNYDG